MSKKENVLDTPTLSADAKNLSGSAAAGPGPQQALGDPAAAVTATKGGYNHTRPPAICQQNQSVRVSPAGIDHKTIIRLCPLLSNAISFEVPGANGQRVRVHELARSPCIKGECELFDIGTYSCFFKRVKP